MTEAKESKHMGARMVSVSELHPHPLNANVMPDDLREKLKAHIKQSGRYPFIVVRTDPDRSGEFQILDGHHRVEVLKDLGHSEVRCDIWDVTDREAKLLLATLNRLEGQDVPVRRAMLIHELLSELSPVDLAGLLPETDKQIEELESLLQFPADEVANLLAEQAEQADRVLPRVLTFVVTPHQEEIIQRAVELASDGTPGRDWKAKGLLNLALHFLNTRGEANGEAQQETA